MATPSPSTATRNETTMSAVVAAAATSMPTEYRILALYRFVPLVTSANENNDNHHDHDTNNDASTNNDNDNDTNTTAKEIIMPKWDPATLMTHPEKHPGLKSLQAELYANLRPLGVSGTLLVAPEGINGTICYPFPPPIIATEISTDGESITTRNKEFDPVATYLKSHPLFGGPNLRTRLSVWKEDNDDDDSSDSEYQIERSKHDKQSHTHTTNSSTIHEEGEISTNNASNNTSSAVALAKHVKQPQPAFQRLKIKIKSEIVTMGLGRPLENHRSQKKQPPQPSFHQQKTDDNNNEEGGSMEVDQLIQSTVVESDSATNPKSIVIQSQSDPSSQSTSTTASSSHQQQPQQPQSCTTNNNNITTERHIQNQKCNPLLTKGQYIHPSQWDQVCHDPNILVIDTRNTYEVEIGTFESALDPKTETFCEFPKYLEGLASEFDWSASAASNSNGVGGENASNASNNATTTNCTPPSNNEKKKSNPPSAIAMFCTGGIRCEKATSYALQSNLFPKDLPIYHLEGGILAYLDYVAKRERDQKEDRVDGGSSGEDNDGTNEDGQKQNDQVEENGKKRAPPTSSSSTFQGECFVFDKRVALTEGLKPSKNYISCYGCRGPMDRHLILSPTTTDSTDNVIDCAENTTDHNGDALYRGISHLPPLRYDARTKNHYLPGLTCPRCHSTTTRESLERFSQRVRQMELSAKEGKTHFRDGKEEKKEEHHVRQVKIGRME